MKKSWLLVSVLALTGILASCGGGQTPSKSDVQSSIIDYGEVNIDDVTIYFGYPEVEFYPIFSLPERSEKLTYEYDSSLIIINADTNTVIAKTTNIANVQVTAKSKHFETTFTVSIRNINKSSTNFNTSPYDSYLNQLKSKYLKKGNDGSTTLFIGDSFFDERYFWTNFSETYVGKDAMCFGISSTTTFDWEVYTDSFLKDIAPKNIVMHCGTNNVYDDHKASADTILDIQRMFNLMHSRLPETNFYYFGISQRAYDEIKQSYVEEINEDIDYWCSIRPWITYIDTPSQLTSDMLRDTIHPKLEYYSVFVNALEETDIVIEDLAIEKGIGFDENSDFSREESKLTMSATDSRKRSYLMNDSTYYNGNFAVSGKIKFTEKIGSNPFLELNINSTPSNTWYDANSALPVSNIIFGSTGLSTVWGYKNGAQRDSLTTISNDECDFTVIGYGNSILFKCDDKVVSYSDPGFGTKYFGIGVENCSVEANLSILTDDTQVGALFEKLAPTPVEEIANIERDTTQVVGSSKSIKYKGETLSRECVLTGKLDITQKTTNSHIEFRFNGMDNRILFWDNASNGNFKLCLAYDVNGTPTEDTYVLGSETLTISWKIVITDNDVYFYVGDELKLVSTAVGTNDPNLFLGSEGTACKFYDMKALTKKSDPAEYQAVLDSMSEAISTYGGYETQSKIRV